ncbi:MAG: DUF5362 family protein [Prevotellaceae bacterium]|jgi:hypothetical protein|nr:DUF5362 family protein [Prevotellaceae bacterium]
MELTNESKLLLGGISKWTKFLAIVGLVFTGLFVLVAFFGSSIITEMQSEIRHTYGAYATRATESVAIMYTIAYLVIAVINFFPAYFLYQFSAQAKKALTANDSITLTNAFNYLKKHYTFVGILVIIMLLLMILSILVVVTAAS